MITEKDLQEAIAECKGQRNPSANTCIKLAAYYTIYDHLFPSKAPEEPIRDARSSGASPQTHGIEFDGDSEFAKAVYGRDMEDVMPVLDELMMTLKAIHPRLYAGVMRKL